MSEANIILNELRAIKQSLLAIERNSASIGGWLPKKAVLKYFDYADNQLRTLERTKAIEVSKVGRRKFYSLKSIITLINQNKQK
jgi:hypothetical protein